jgi:hypothetical protein
VSRIVAKFSYVCLLVRLSLLTDMTAVDASNSVSFDTFPISEYPYLLDNISPITEDQARSLVRIGWRCRIFKR